MKKSVLIILSAAIIGSSSSFLFVNATTKTKRETFVQDELIIKFKKESVNLTSPMGANTARNFSDALGLSQKNINGEFNLTLWKNTKKTYSLDALITALEKSSLIESVQKNYLYYTSNTPNDARFDEVWGIHNTGQSVNSTIGTTDADIDGTEAWNTRTDATNVIVAVLDTGIKADHEDLASNLWINTAENTGTPGVDDDGNGYIDDINGYIFPTSTGSLTDFNGHGTHISGTIGAQGNNSVGVTGIAWNTQIMSLGIFTDDPSGPSASTIDIIDALTYARDNGAHIVNASWGGSSFDSSLKAAIDAMPNVLIVAAAGNSSANNDSSPIYPAGFNSPNILSVAATNQNDTLASFSNYGASSVDVAAPGENILSTTNDGGYGFLDGTSMATPLVAGMAAILLGENSNLIASNLRYILITSSDFISGLNGKVIANGRVNLNSALLLVNSSSNALIERNDSLNNQKIHPGTSPEVLDFILTNNYTETITVDSLDLFGNMNTDENINLILTGSGFSFTENTGTLTGSGSVISITTGSGFTLTPGESKEVSTVAVLPADTNINEFKLNISDVTLSSGSGVSLISGSGLSLTSPLSGSLFQIFPNTFSLDEQFPLNNQNIVSTSTQIIGEIGGTFDLTDFTLDVVITQNGSTFSASNYATTFTKNNRTFSITLNTDFSESDVISIATKLVDSTFEITGQTIAFTVTTTTAPAANFTNDQSLNQDLIIPIDFDNQEFDATNKIDLLPGTEIPDVSAGLVVSIPAGTNISKNPSDSNYWGGEMTVPSIMSIPLKSIFSSAVGVPSGKTFTPKKRFSVGSPNVSLLFDQAITFTVPVTGSGLFAIYYSQDGVNWTRDTSCTITNGFCNFQTNHFTEFTLGTESDDDTVTPQISASHGSSRQNHVRFGGYDPRNPAKQFSPAQQNTQTILRKRSSKEKFKYIPCEIDENDITTNTLYQLKLSQGAARGCREDYGNFDELPYRTFQK